MTEWLVDTSALVRLGGASDSARWASAIERGLVRICTVTLLELGYAARSGDSMRRSLAEPPLVRMPRQALTPAMEDRALEVQQVLADRGHHRAPSIADLIVAAVAELSGLVVLHVDKDFDLIASVTGQEIERLAVT